MRLVAERSLSYDERSACDNFRAGRDVPSLVVARVLLAVAALAVGFLGGAQLQQVVAASQRVAPPDRAVDPAAHAERPPAPDVAAGCPRGAEAPPYPVNGRGMTLGSAGPGVVVGPDLVVARGVDGRCGWIRAGDRDEALLALASGRGSYVVTLFGRDGVSVVGRARLTTDP